MSFSGTHGVVRYVILVRPSLGANSSNRRRMVVYIEVYFVGFYAAILYLHHGLFPYQVSQPTISVSVIRSCKRLIHPWIGPSPSTGGYGLL